MIIGSANYKLLSPYIMGLDLNLRLDNIMLTMMKLYPAQRKLQLSGHSGTLIVCECMVITFVGVSQTAHFEMYFSMSGPLIGVIIIGMGSVVLSQ